MRRDAAATGLSFPPCYDKSRPMRPGQLFASLLLIMAVTSGCGGGGGGGADFAPTAIWGQFRQNNLRTGLGIGVVQTKDAIVDMEFVDEVTVENPMPSAISSSPAIDADGRLYIGSEGGTLAGFDGDDDLNKMWSVNQCDRCPAGNRGLGRLVSSPAAYTFENMDGHNNTSIFLGSADGAVFLFSFLENDPVVDSGKCDVCFWRNDPILQEGFIASDPGATVSAAFVSSPTFSANLGTGSIAGIFIGAVITIVHSDGSIETQGKLYAINQDGSLRWEFPRAGDAPIAPVTSSPAFAIGSTLYFTTDADPNSAAPGDILYSLTEAGNLKRSVSIAGLTDPTLLFSPSPMSAAAIFVPGVDGVVHAMNPDGTFLWTNEVEGERFTTSLVLGSQNEITPTAEPEATETPTPTGTLVELTPTATETPLRLDSNLLGITESGMLVVLDSRDGQIVSPSGPLPRATVEGTVVSSPALSSDLFLVFGTTGGQVFNINSANGQSPRSCNGGQDDGNLCTDDIDCVDGFCEEPAWPILLPRSCDAGARRTQFCESDDECPGGACVRPAIRSSPSLDLDGTIYVGADDGRIYAIDEGPTATESVSPAATPTPRASVTATQTPEATPTVTSTIEPSATPEATSTVGMTPTEETTPTGEPTSTADSTPTGTPDTPFTSSPTPDLIETPTAEPTAESTATTAP